MTTGNTLNKEKIPPKFNSVGVRNYTIDILTIQLIIKINFLLLGIYVEEGKGVRVDIKVLSKFDPSANNIYNYLKIYGSNYSCANDQGNAFVSVNIFKKYY